MIRTHKCADLRIDNDKKKVKLVGWAQRIRDHGGKKFIDLRDREGITQIVFDPDVTKNFTDVEHFRREFLINVEGVVRPRPSGTINKKHATGEVEVLISSFEVINECEVLPFDIDKDKTNDVNEDLRLEFRYLDLRRLSMQKSFMRRHKFISKIRNFLDKEEFVEVETPLLTKSTPEGARDMLVPSRKHHGSFYALPQSPQLFKQLLMVAGFEKYYQVARCFRDEDSRKDRQLEFTQIDIEMSFVDFDEFKVLMQKVLIDAFGVYDVKISDKNFSVISYHESMDRFGSDKPDLRISGLELCDISDITSKCSFSVFKNVVKSGGLVKGLRVPNGQDKFSRKKVDKFIKFCQEHGAKGMAWMKVMKGGEVESSISKFFKPEELKAINDKLQGKEGDLLFFIADKKDTTNDVLDALRRELAEKLDLIDKKTFSFAWIVDFPLFKWNEDDNRLEAEHSPFTMPIEKDVKFITSKIKSASDIDKFKDELLKLKGDCYDITMNGIEICSGALRIYKPELQKKVFEIIQLSEEQIESQFGWFLKAYNYGAPFHRGLAFGVDRMVMLLEDKKSIREVMAFPKNKVGHCPLTKSPSVVDNLQLRDLGIEVKKKKEDKQK